jgi:hypothetical protein
MYDFSSCPDCGIIVDRYFALCCSEKMSIEPTYFERDRYDLPLPLIGLNPNIIARETTLIQSEASNLAATQQRLISQALESVLMPIGVRFEFSIDRQPQQPAAIADNGQTMIQSPTADLQTLEHRLWVRCYSQKSLDCQILAEPLAKALRSINLQGFKTAIIKFSRFSAGASRNQVADWQLRVDLTPVNVRLKNWARWGDVQSISKLLNFVLAPKEIQVTAVLKNLTLQIYCTLTNPVTGKSPSKKIVVDTIAPLLIALTPQGIQGATIHGVQSFRQLDESPVWIHWLDLPGLGDPKFSPTPIMLAARGDRDALSFILERLINPDLEQCFAIGGIQLSILHRRHLIHVMSESPTCPIQSQIASTVVKVIQQLGLPGIRGVRIYGRISGQSISKWNYGVDFDRAPLELPPVAVDHQFVVEPSIPVISLVDKISTYLVGTGIWKPQFALLKTNQLVYEPRFRWEPSLLLLLVGLGAILIGDLAIKSMLPSQLTINAPEKTPQLSFNNSLLELKLEQYKLHCNQNGVPDILIVGSSRALRGVDPAIFRNNLIGNNANLQIYNFGINGATAQVVDLILRQLLDPETLPRMVLWADGSRAFNSGRIDRTHETIIASDRYRKMALSLGLKNSTNPFVQIQSSVQTTYQAVDMAIEAQLAELSPAYRHRDLVKDLLRTQLPDLAQLADPNHATTSNDPSASINERDINADGFLPLKLQFDPTTYYQKYTKVAGDSDGDYADFRLQGNQDVALQQTINLLATQKIPLIFVNLPLSDIYLDGVRHQHEIKFKAYMQKMMDAHRLTFVDMDGLLNTKYDRFSDPSHLNQAGAQDVSEYLTQIKEIRLGVRP